jgi:hypothetical protein
MSIWHIPSKSKESDLSAPYLDTLLNSMTSVMTLTLQSSTCLFLVVISNFHLLMACITPIDSIMIDWLFSVLHISLTWRRHHCRWRDAKFRPMLGAQGLWAGRNFYRATSAVTRDLDFSGLIRRTTPFSRLLRHTRGCGGSILTRILTGPDWFDT